MTPRILPFLCALLSVSGFRLGPRFPVLHCRGNKQMSDVSLLAEPVLPRELPADDLIIVSTEDNGFCLYDSVLKAYGVDDASYLQQWQLACSVAARIERLRADPQFVENFLTEMEDAVVGGREGERGYPLQAVAEQGEPYILMGGTERKYVGINDLAKSLWTLRDNDITKGPMMWPDIQSIGIPLALLNPNVGWALYNKSRDGTKYFRLEGVSSMELAKRYIDLLGEQDVALRAELTPIQNPSHVIMLNHIGGNHYQLLRPTEAITNDLLQGQPTGVIERCNLTAVGIAILQQGDNVLLQILRKMLQS